MKQRIENVLRNITYPGLRFEVGFFDTFEEVLWLRVVCDGTCNITGEDMKWNGRKWAVSKHMTDGEIVQTAFKAVLTAQEHEARELFKYRGASVFDPHYDIEKLVKLRNQPDALKERVAV